MTIVHVVGVVVVPDGLVSATFAVCMVMAVVGDVGVGRAFVPVPVVATMGMPVV